MRLKLENARIEITFPCACGCESLATRLVPIESVAGTNENPVLCVTLSAPLIDGSLFDTSHVTTCDTDTGAADGPTEG